MLTISFFSSLSLLKRSFLSLLGLGGGREGTLGLAVGGWREGSLGLAGGGGVVSLARPSQRLWILGGRRGRVWHNALLQLVLAKPFKQHTSSMKHLYPRAQNGVEKAIYKRGCCKGSRKAKVFSIEG